MLRHKPFPHNTSSKGFTLIEMTLVLVIIGLIAAVITSGKDLIRDAKMRKLVSQLDKYSTAAAAFRLKYNGLPGDLENAVAFGLGDTGCTYPPPVPPAMPTHAGCNGNGDGLLTNDTQHSENINFWYHLSEAGLLPLRYDGLTVAFGQGAPETNLEGAGLYAGSLSIPKRKNIFFIGLNDDPLVTEFRITPHEAFLVDAKKDDGKPSSGKSQHYMVGSIAPLKSQCVAAGSPEEYNITNDIDTCVMYVDVGI